MKKVILAAMAAILVLPAVASAEAWDILRCKLLEGKNFDDLEQIVTEWRLLMDKTEYKDFKVQILQPLSGPRVGPGIFFWVGSAPTAERLGGAQDYWFSDPSAARMKAKLDTVFLCDERWGMRTVFER
jgi:hypothetical protein